ncbi:acyltransferase family protein [Anaerocolumna aminovalerica]|uniref:Fucose 4-O-acetylase n=1 Tax=Anaerocolumna aminovalerica TaxID=1527 RepID=A0A1I5EG31_9FIRM|nr:acyltransferase [Anaerocolumna aminovalerica]SFO10447.1 Fucose 4-O-acetylase [Anaerocolumna aminovalerica]
MNKPKYYNIAFLRVFATISVVLGHTLMYESHIMLNVYKVVYSYNMPLFVFISGFLFMDSQIRNNCKFLTVVTNKFKRLIIPTFIVSLFWILPAHIFISQDMKLSISTIFEKGKDLLLGNVEYLWFLLMLYWVIIMFYPISKLFKTRYSNILIPIVGMTLIFIYLKTSLYNMPNFYSISQASKYIFYFYLGAVFGKYHVAIDSFIRKNKVIVMFIAIYFVLNGQVYIIFKYDTYVGAWFITSHIWSYLVVSTVTVIFLYVLSVCCNDYIEKWFKRSKFISFIDKESLGIYYVHTQMGTIMVQLISKIKLPLTRFNKISTLFISMVLLSSLVILFYNKIKTKLKQTILVNLS